MCDLIIFDEIGWQCIGFDVIFDDWVGLPWVWCDWIRFHEIGLQLIDFGWVALVWLDWMGLDVIEIDEFV